MVELLREAVASDDHKASTSDDTSFSALELLNDLARIAVNDKNKLDVSTIARGHASMTLVLSLVVIIDVSAVARRQSLYSANVGAMSC